MGTKDFQCVVENEMRETKYKVDTQSMRLFGLRNDHAEDVHRADANRLEKKICVCVIRGGTWHLVRVRMKICVQLGLLEFSDWQLAQALVEACHLSLSQASPRHFQKVLVPGMMSCPLQ